MSKAASNFIKMKVLGALENAPGDSMREQYIAVSQMIFKDEEGVPHQFTWRTIQTWWYHYRQHGFTHAKPRADKGRMRKLAPEDLLEAVEKAKPFLKDSGRNVTGLYRLCIEKGFLRKEQIASNTFRRAVKKYDLLKPEEGAPTNKKRLAFAKAHANDLWQVDTMHGPYMKFKNKEGLPWPVQVYLICFIDDASRVIPHGQFYLADDTEALIRCFQDALYKRGVPKAIYADNGSNYSSKEFAHISERLGCILIHTPTRDGAAKGKIERFFRTVRDQFLIQDLSAISDLDTLNKLFFRWVEDTYHLREHEGIGMKPLDRFGMDLNQVRYLNQSAFSEELFFLEETRKVRIDNTFSFKNIRYEAPRDLRGQRIIIRFNRLTQTTPTPIVYESGVRLGAAAPLEPIHNDRKPNIEPLF